MKQTTQAPASHRLGYSVSLINYVRELYAYRELLLSFASRQIKIRYKQTLMGISWAIVQPIMMMVVFTVIFKKFINVSSEGLPYPIFSYSALLPWTFFSSSVGSGSNSLVMNANLVQKIYFPRETLPIASIMAAGVDFSIASLIFAGMMVYYHVPITAAMVFLALLLPMQVMFTAAVVFVFSAANVHFRDVRYGVQFLMQLWLYATPIAFSMEVVPEHLRLPYVILNPMAGLIDSFRGVLLHGRAPVPEYLLVVGVVSVTLFFGSYVFFKRLEGTFADVI